MSSFSIKDLEFISNFVKGRDLKKLFITGDVQVGKSSFCEKFIKKLTNFKFINLDKVRDKETGKSRSKVLSEVIKENKTNYYILEHYDLLDKNYEIDRDNPNTLSVWKKEADILILLNLKGTGIIDTTKQKDDFDRLDGKIIYSNSETCLYVKCMNNYQD